MKSDDYLAQFKMLSVVKVDWKHCIDTISFN